MTVDIASPNVDGVAVEVVYPNIDGVAKGAGKDGVAADVAAKEKTGPDEAVVDDPKPVEAGLVALNERADVKKNPLEDALLEDWE